MQSDGSRLVAAIYDLRTIAIPGLINAIEEIKAAKEDFKLSKNDRKTITAHTEALIRFCNCMESLNQNGNTSPLSNNGQTEEQARKKVLTNPAAYVVESFQSSTKPVTPIKH